MNKKHIHFSLFIAFIFSFPALIYSQSCPFVSYKKVFYENDSTMYPNNTINAVNVATDSAYFVGGSQIAKIDWKGNRMWNLKGRGLGYILLKIQLKN